MSKKVVIIGAGPAGLTAAKTLLDLQNYEVIIVERDAQVGGLSKTVNYKGNRMDIGGHRFFSKSPLIMKMWTDILTPETTLPSAGSSKVMLQRNRKSSILFRGRFFDYPLNFTFKTFKRLGLVFTLRSFASYLNSRIKPVNPVKNLEDFYINRFGRLLYKTFFRDYTAKVWGVHCCQIGHEWGQQRIRQFSAGRMILHALRSLFMKSSAKNNKTKDTTLISSFLYPKYGPGQLWDEVAALIKEKGGKILLNYSLNTIHISAAKVDSLTVVNSNGELLNFLPDFVISTIAIDELIESMDAHIPDKVREVASGLVYRDFITVGLLFSGGSKGIPPENWVYIQDNNIKAGRIQFFNNWSPYLLNNPQNLWAGVEYFCSIGDELWQMNDDELIKLAAHEMELCGFVNASRKVDGTVIRSIKAYPAYYGSYPQFHTIREFIDGIENLIPAGRNGMHRYNNQDHSMLSALEAVKLITGDSNNRNALWNVNADDSYHESQ